MRFTLGTINLGTPLPIELLTFSATPKESAVLLKWTTASETNNNFFTIERSSNGTEWTEIGSQKGAGNSSTILNYELYDFQPLLGVNYYRLKQTDFDREYTYSVIETVKFTSSTALEV